MADPCKRHAPAYNETCADCLFAMLVCARSELRQAEDVMHETAGELRLLASTLAAGPDVNVIALVTRLGDIADAADGTAPAPSPAPGADALREALRDAIEAIERAEPNRHSPWCNGVHEGGCCEGEYLMSGFMARLRAALSVGETPDDEKEGGR